eukprot:GHVN01097221.1.p1 GENE.GHVN01097221.1~~GHVN01097221.1.p1  ORF type:complete len:593 (+),score=81.81 GHVN01097221.1:140-1918(+)
MGINGPLSPLSLLSSSGVSNAATFNRQRLARRFPRSLDSRNSLPLRGYIASGQPLRSKDPAVSQQRQMGRKSDISLPSFLKRADSCFYPVHTPNQPRLQARTFFFRSPPSLAPTRSPYAVLGVDASASQQDVKKSFRELAKKHHPDLNPNDPNAAARMTEITEAYELLSSPEKRAFFDQTGMHPDSNGGGGGGGHGGGGPFTSAGRGGDEWVFSEFADLFGRMSGFEQGQGAPTSVRGADVAVQLSLTFREAVDGCRKTVQVADVRVACESCGGSGCAPGTGMVQCEPCQGMGVSKKRHGHIVLGIKCEKCNGHGKIIAHPCRTCSGRGVSVQNKEVTVELPAGVRDSTELCIKNKGHAGVRGGPPGALWLQCVVKPDKVFKWIDDDIHVDVNMTLKQSVLGGEVRTPTLDGSIEVRIDQGTPDGTKKVLRGKGPVKMNSHGRGHQIVHLHTVIPKTLTSRQKELIEEFDRIERGVDNPQKPTQPKNQCSFGGKSPTEKKATQTDKPQDKNCEAKQETQHQASTSSSKKKQPQPPQHQKSGDGVNYVGEQTPQQTRDRSQAGEAMKKQKHAEPNEQSSQSTWAKIKSTFSGE